MAMRTLHLVLLVGLCACAEPCTTDVCHLQRQINQMQMQSDLDRMNDQFRQTQINLQQGIQALQRH